MAQNETAGPIQATSLSLVAINVAFAQLQESVDIQRGLRGNVPVASPLAISGTPSNPTDSARLMDRQVQVTDPFLWLLRGNI